MSKLKDYTGSVYGGLGQLLYLYCQTHYLNIPATLLKIQNVERFDFNIWRELLNHINQMSPSSTLGLDISKYVKPHHLSIIAYIALSCDTLAEALHRYHQYHRLIYDGSALKVDIQPDTIAVRWEKLPPHLTTQITDEIAIALLVQFLRMYLAAEDRQIAEVHFRSPVPLNMAAYERFFHCKLKFSQPTVQIILPIQFLAMPIRQADPTLQKLLMQQAQNLLDKIPNITQLEEHLQQAILIGIQKNNYQIDSSPYGSFSAIYKKQHSTYQQRVQEIRKVLAIQCLQDPYLSLQEIALLLSYSEQSAFHRAFKQWMGITPQQ